MRPITITILQGRHGLLMVTDMPRPAPGVALTPVQSLVWNIMTNTDGMGYPSVYDPKAVPLVALAESLLNPEEFGWAVTHEVRDCAREALGRPAAERQASTLPDMVHLTQANFDALQEAKAERDRLHALVNSPQTAEFLAAVASEKAHQVERWGPAHDRGKSAENWFWLVGFLAGKACRAVITGDKQKALHHTISAAAALANWHDAISRDTTGTGIGTDSDLVEIARFEGHAP